MYLSLFLSLTGFTLLLGPEPAEQQKPYLVYLEYALLIIFNCNSVRSQRNLEATLTSYLWIQLY